MEYLGIKFDKEANAGVRGVEKKISAEDSKVAVYVIPTNEEARHRARHKGNRRKMWSRRLRLHLNKSLHGYPRGLLPFF